jgi:hypothetical protein
LENRKLDIKEKEMVAKSDEERKKRDHDTREKAKDRANKKSKE